MQVTESLQCVEKPWEAVIQTFWKERRVLGKQSELWGGKPSPGTGSSSFLSPPSRSPQHLLQPYLLASCSKRKLLESLFKALEAASPPTPKMKKGRQWSLVQPDHEVGDEWLFLRGRAGQKGQTLEPGRLRFEGTSLGDL